MPRTTNNPTPHTRSYITLGQSHYGKTPLTICHYQLKEDTTPMNSFNRIYLHNTYKYTNLEELLEYSWRRNLAGIGYHFAIDTKGTIFNTRPINLMGAHIYGENRESIGIVFLNADSCAKSKTSLGSFQQLYTSLSHQAEKPLTVQSHSYGQCEYLQHQITLYNQNLPIELQITPLQFDSSICEDEKVEQKRIFLRETLTQMKQKIPTPKQPQYQLLRRLTEELKVCPGKSYYQFVNSIK